MKIAFALDDSLDKSDGVQNYVLTLSKWLAGKGHEIHFLAGQTSRKDISNIHSLARISKVRFNRNILSTPIWADSRQIKKLLNQHKFDIIHIQMPFSPFFVGHIIKLSPPETKIVATFHILPFSSFQAIGNKLLAQITRSNLARVDKFISVSEPAREFAAHIFDIKSIVIPNAVEFIRPNKNKPKYSNKKGPMLIFIGRLVSRKGCRQLIEALSKINIAQKWPNLHLDIVGAGPEAKSIQKLIQTKNLNHFITLHGFVDAKTKFDMLSDADLAIFPSLGGESFGIVLIEAMANSRAVVLAGNNPGYKSVIIKKDQLIDPKNSQEFANLIEKYLSSGHLRQKTVEWQLQTVKQYDINVVGLKILNIYVSLLAKTG